MELQKASVLHAEWLKIPAGSSSKMPLSVWSIYYNNSLHREWRSVLKMVWTHVGGKDFHKSLQRNNDWKEGSMMTYNKMEGPY